MKTPGEQLRMIGSAHAQAMILVWIRQHIGAIDGRYAPRIHPRHTKKRAARNAVLRPLRELESRISESHRKTQAAYRVQSDKNG
jgi:hypothetical protein